MLDKGNIDILYILLALFIVYIFIIKAKETLEALENMLEQKERAVEASNQSIKDKYHLGNLNSGLYQQQADQLSQIKYRIDSLKKIKLITILANV